MQTSKKVSIIIPVYNRESLIGRCLDSLCKQSYSNIEIIVINDGSSDNSYDICKKIAMSDNRIKLITKVNSGVSDTRNVGIDSSSGDYITFVDSDDYVESDYVEKLLDLCSEHDCQIAFCGYSQDYNNFHKKLYFPFAGVCKIVNISSGYPDKALFPRFVCTGLFKKSIISKLRFIPDLSYGEDRIFSMNAIFNSNKVAYTNETLYHFWLEPVSLSRNAFDDYKTFLAKYLEPNKDMLEAEKKKFYCVATLFCDYLKGLIVEYSDNSYFLSKYYSIFLKKFRHYFLSYWFHFNQGLLDTMYEIFVFCFPRSCKRIKNFISKIR